MSDSKPKTLKAANVKKRASKASKARGSFFRPHVSPTEVSEVDIVKSMDIEPPNAKLKDTKTMYVLKKRKSSVPEDFNRKEWFFDERKSSKFSDIKFQKNTDLLSVEAISPEIMTWHNIRRASPEPWKIIHRQPHYDRLYHYNLDKSLRLEKSSLNLFQEMKKLQLKTENYLMAKTGKLRSGLLLRRKQLLPKIGEKGDETDLLLLEKAVRPKTLPKTDLFVYDRYNSMLKKGILPVIKNKDRGFAETREWIGCPDVTDYILEDLHLQHRHEGDDSFTFDDENFEFTPHIPLLGVRASKIQRHGRRSVRIDAQSATSIIRRSKDKRFKAHESVFRERHFIGGSVLEESESLLALKFGDQLLEWTTDWQRSLQTVVVGVGCWAQYGRKGIGSLNMTNVGTTAIYFHFEKEVCPSPLRSPSPTKRTFVFDSWGGSILPNEVYRIPFLYNASTLGIFSEDWRLMTKPVLENGAKILLRLTGITRHIDKYSHRDLKIDQKLQKRQSVMFARQLVEELVKYLPVSQYSFKDTLFANVCKGMDMFLLLNPGFQYTTAPVFRLGKLMDLMQRRKSSREEILTEETVADIEIAKGSELTIISQEYTEEMEYEDYFAEEFEESLEDGGEESPAKHSRRFSLKPKYLSLQRKSEAESNPIKVLYARLDPDNDNLKVFTYNHTTIWRTGDEDATAATSTPLVDAGPQDVVQRPFYPKAPVNLTNTELKIDALREVVYNDLSTPEMQNAHFTVFYREVDKLCFRPWHASGMNVKYLIARTQLCNLLDTFCDTVDKFKTSCYLELKPSNALDLEENSFSYPLETLLNRPTEQLGKSVSLPTNSFSVTGPKSLMRLKEIKSAFDTNKLWTALRETKFIPKERPEVINYISHDALAEIKDEGKINERRGKLYMPFLYGTMYRLLSDFLDELDTLFYSLPKSKEKPNRPETFISVSNIPMPSKMESLVYVKKPDTYWVKVAKKMNEVASLMQKSAKSVSFHESSHSQIVWRKTSTSTVRSRDANKLDPDREQATEINRSKVNKRKKELDQDGKEHEQVV